jgi:hypothetical membrane protein
VYLIGVYLYDMCLIGVYLYDMYLYDMCFIGVYLRRVPRACMTGIRHGHTSWAYVMGMHLLGLCLMGVHLIDAYFIDVYISDPWPCKWWCGGRFVEI